MTQRGRTPHDHRSQLADCELFRNCDETALDELEAAMIDDAWVEPGVTISAASAPDVLWLVCAGAVAVRHDEGVSIVEEGQAVSSDGPVGLAGSSGLREVESAWIVRFAPRALIEIDGIDPLARACATREARRPHRSDLERRAEAAPPQAPQRRAPSQAPRGRSWDQAV